MSSSTGYECFRLDIIQVLRLLPYAILARRCETSLLAPQTRTLVACNMSVTSVVYLRGDAAEDM